MKFALGIISVISGILGGVWLASLFYHSFFYTDTWTTVPVVLTGLAIVALCVLAGVGACIWLEDNL